MAEKKPKPKVTAPKAKPVSLPQPPKEKKKPVTPEAKQSKAAESPSVKEESFEQKPTEAPLPEPEDVQTTNLIPGYYYYYQDQSGVYPMIVDPHGNAYLYPGYPDPYGFMPQPEMYGYYPSPDIETINEEE